MHRTCMNASGLSMMLGALAMLALGSAAPACADAAASADETLVGAPADPPAARHGRRLYLRHCASCHGPTATLGAGGDITGLPENLVAMAVRGFEQMPAVELTREEIAAITAWLDHLASR
ncbi:MAG TPA: hypothetical protein DDY29_05935 [Rhodobacteraceae bacterium]|jgi:mono/diheme cytochrome c family protein|nr:cytochrome c [Paracoccaceae bacterium]HBG98272.1 hypothetical protein [Paracoccaceae bacterium]